MSIRYTVDPNTYKEMSNEEVRDTFLVDSLFENGTLNLLYSEVDRTVLGGAVPLEDAIRLEPIPELTADHFCDRREVGVMNIGGPGTVVVDGDDYTLDNTDVLYVGRGSQEIRFESAQSSDPAEFYLASYLAHKTYPTEKYTDAEADQVELGSKEKSSSREIYQHIHKDGIQSCQLMMGYTELRPGNVWNTMPCHTHERRSEVYMYFDLPEDEVIFHLMGTEDCSRKMVMENKDAVISPPWSLHAGCGTQNYKFVWCMGGENQSFEDMDLIDPTDLR